jgi:hypothetical protein
VEPCLESGGRIELENTKADAVAVEVTVSNGSLGYEQTEELDAGSGTTLTGLEDGIYQVVTRAADDGTVLATETVEVDCTEEADGRDQQDTTVASNDCEQLTVTNPGENEEAVDFRIRNGSGLVTTVDDVAPGESRTVEPLDAGDYTVDARFVQDDQFSSDNVTVDGQVEASVSAGACEKQPSCPSGLEIRYDIGNGTWDPSWTLGVEFRGGDETGATFFAPFPVDVYVIGGNVYEQQHSSVSGEFTVTPVSRNGKDDADISHVWVVCQDPTNPLSPTVGTAEA